MSTANWLTLIASFITLFSVIVSYRLGKQQIKNAHELALKQIRAAAEETSRRLKAEVLLKDKQVWIKEFRETVNELLYLGDPFLDKSVSGLSVQQRVEQITRLAHKIDLLLPVGDAHAGLAKDVAALAEHVRHQVTDTRMRLSLTGRITTLTREILRAELASVKANL